MSLILAIVFILTASLLNAGQNRWTSTGPFLADFGNVEVAPSNGNVMVAVHTLGPFRSLNAGKTWQLLTYPGEYGYPQILKIHPKNPNIFVAIDKDVYKTNDAGKTWQQISQLPFNQQSLLDLEFDRSDPETLYAVVEGYWYDSVIPSKVFKSKDGGRTWSVIFQKSDFDEPHMELEIDPKNHQTLFLIIANRFYRSLNGGGSWQRLRALNDHVGNLTIDPATSNLYVQRGEQILKSVNQGKSWEILSAPECGALSIDPIDTRNFYLSRQDCIYKSTDSGQTWKQLSFPFSDLRYPDLTPLVPNTTKSGFLLFEKNVLYRSEDGGTTWHINTQGTGSSSSLVRINSNGDLLAESFHQYFLRKHGSSKWVLLNVPVGFSALDYEFHLADPSFIVAGGRFGTSAKSIMKSADGGKSWQIQKGPFVIVDRILTDPRNPKTIYSLGCLYSSRKSAVATSHDAGSTWVITRTGLSCLGLNFAADFQHSPDLYVTALEGIAKSGDQGKTWQRLSTIRADAAIKSLDITPTRLYALILDNQGIYSVYFSTDAGKNWQKGNNLPTTDTVFFIKADHTREGTVFIGGPGLFVSKDGGQNWSTFDTNGLPSDQSVSDFYVDPSNPADYWISAANGIYNYTN